MSLPLCAGARPRPGGIQYNLFPKRKSSILVILLDFSIASQEYSQLVLKKEIARYSFLTFALLVLICYYPLLLTECHY